MKNYLVIILLLVVGQSLVAQPENDLGKIALSVIMPDNVDGLDDSQLSKIETKITQIVTTTGCAASGYNNNFVIYPKFAIYETNIVEGGMQNITVTTCELSLFIQQVDNHVIFASIYKTLKGSGSNQSAAITNAISKTPTNDPQFKTFIETGKNKIIQYYESRCQDIILKAETLVKMQDFEQAIGLLMSVPEEVSCFQQVQKQSVEAYKAYQNQRCSELLQVARAELAANDYYKALHTLSEIDPATPCFTDAQTMVNNAADKVDAEDKKFWDFRMKVYNDAVALEKLRIDAIKNISLAYFNSRPTTVTYTYLVR